MSNNQKTTILYVDDEEINLYIFEQTFQDDYKVFTANSGEEGLKQLDNHAESILVVISDMRMPNMNGVEFITQAKAKHQKIIYFVLTGYSYNDEIDHAIQNNIIHKFFTKPFNKTEIDLAISEALQG